MECFTWYLANADGSDCKPQADASLPDFLIDVDEFVAPLFALLSPKGQAAGDLKVLEKTIFRDPRLEEYPPVANVELLEIKQINPELIRLLAHVPIKQSAAIAGQWFAAPPVRDFLLRWGSSEVEEAQARKLLQDVLSDLIKLAKRAVRAKKEVMERFWWRYEE